MQTPSTVSTLAVKNRIFHTLSFVGAVVGVLAAVTGWVMLSRPILHRTGPGASLALGAAGLWFSVAGWLLYRRAQSKGTDTKFSQTLLWVGLSCSFLASLAFLIF